MKRIRCSSLPLRFACPASGHGAMSVTETHEAASAGSAAHAAMAAHVTGFDADLDSLALRFGVDRDEIGRLSFFGRKAWAELKVSFPDPEPEVEVRAFVGDVELVGHLDIRSRVGKEVRVLDWKSGRVDHDYFNQLAGYAYCEMAVDDSVDSVVFTVVWLRDQDVVTHRFTRSMMAEWERELLALADSPTDFRVGHQCETCPRSHECPALLSAARRDVSIFAGPDAESMLSAATPGQLVAIRRRAKLVAKFAESVDDVIRKVVDQLGPLDSGDGAELKLVTEAGPRQVDTLAAWPVLEARLSPEELASCVTVRLTRVQDAVAEKAPDRGKGKARKEVAEALEAAGAITPTTVRKLKEVRKPKEIIS
jgi:Protein of unknown function (DUF2800)